MSTRRHKVKLSARGIAGKIHKNGRYVEESYKVVVDRLKSLIELRGTNIRVLAKEAGLGETYLYDIVTGKNKKPSVPHLAAAAKVLGSTLAYIVGEEENNPGSGGTEQGMFAMPITGIIEAGVFLADSKTADRVMLQATPNAEHPLARHFALEVRDDSFSGAAEGGITRGGYVLCVDVADAKLAVETGGIYVIRRTLDHGNSWETILRRAKVFRDHCELRAENQLGGIPLITVKGTLSTNPTREVYAHGLVYGVQRLFKR